MGPVRLVLDSNILIQALHSRPLPSIHTLLNGEDELVISAIAWMEVMAGAGPEQETGTRNFLTRFTVHEVTPAIAETAVQVRKTLRLPLPDAIAYATALTTGRTLLTLNSRDFPRGTPSVLIPA